MTNHAGRLYALALGLVVFFLAWAVVSARPWATAAPDPRLKALAVRQAQLGQEAKLVSQIVAQRAQLAAVARSRQLASAAVAAPATAASAPVQVVNLPPLTITRTS
jgi:hypothetical protein